VEGELTQDIRGIGECDYSDYCDYGFFEVLDEILA
jgi:hypothetical protein